MRRFVRMAGLTLAAALGAAPAAVAQTPGVETLYPAPPSAPKKSIETLYPAPPGTPLKSIETLYPSAPPPGWTASPWAPPAPAPRPVAPALAGGGPSALGAAPTAPVVPAPAGLPAATTEPAALPADATARPNGEPAPAGGPTTVAPTTATGVGTGVSAAQWVNDPFGRGSGYYLPSSSPPVYLWQPPAAVPSPASTPGARTQAPMVVNPALYPNGVILRQYNSPNPYAAPRYVTAPAPRR